MITAGPTFACLPAKIAKARFVLKDDIVNFLSLTCLVFAKLLLSEFDEQFEGLVIGYRAAGLGTCEQKAIRSANVTHAFAQKFAVSH